jgi:hypothetical protein
MTALLNVVFHQFSLVFIRFPSSFLSVFVSFLFCLMPYDLEALRRGGPGPGDPDSNPGTSEFQRAELGLAYLDIEKERAKERQVKAGKEGRNIQLGLAQKEANPKTEDPHERRATAKAAKKAGLKRTTLVALLTVCSLMPLSSRPDRLACPPGRRTWGAL